jgi:hypothetical protein
MCISQSVNLLQACISYRRASLTGGHLYRRVSHRRASLTGGHLYRHASHRRTSLTGMYLAGVRLTGVRLRAWVFRLHPSY